MKLKMPILRAVCGAAAAAVMSAMILTSCAGIPEAPEFPSSSGSSFASSSSAASSSSTAASSAPASSSQPASSASGSAASSSGMNEENSPSSSTASSSVSSSASSSSGTVSIAAYQREVLRLVNIERQKAGVAPLTMDNTALTAAAMKRAEELQKLFEHTRPDGSDCFTVLKEYNVPFPSARSYCAGENIAYGQRTPAEVVNAWMNSPGHRANILKDRFSQIGVGYFRDQQGRANWVQLFIGA